MDHLLYQDTESHAIHRPVKIVYVLCPQKTDKSTILKCTYGVDSISKRPKEAWQFGARNCLLFSTTSNVSVMLFTTQQSTIEAFIHHSRTCRLELCSFFSMLI